MKKKKKKLLLFFLILANTIIYNVTQYVINIYTLKNDQLCVYQIK